MLELNDPEKKKVKIKGELFEISEPSFEVAESFNEQLNGSSEKGSEFKTIKAYMVQCGLPELVLNKLSLSQVLQLVDYINPKKK